MNKCLRIITLTISFLLLPLYTSGATKVFEVSPRAGAKDHSGHIRSAINRAERWLAAHTDDSAVVRLSAGAVYNLSRAEALALPYYVSNTTSNEENPGNPLKHVGLLFRGLRNFTFDGNGATLLTHGEMTPWVIDGCGNIKLCDFTIDAADPSVPEMTIIAVDDTSFTAQTNARTAYRIADGRLYWQGIGWEFGGGIAQYFDPADSITLRCASPLNNATRVDELAPGVLRFFFTECPAVAREGVSYQMRHSFRTEVAGLITGSEDVALFNLKLHFMGNFGIVAQTSSNIYYKGLVCAPDTEKSGRHNAGFADFLQVSGCRGKVNIEGCTFAGAHDDPINIHGTHLAVTQVDELATEFTAEYQHPQTFGYQSFFPADTLVFVNPHTLLEVGRAVVAQARMMSPHQIRVVIRDSCPALTANQKLVVENISWTPEVQISDNTFTLTPTRAILVSTRRPVVISGNRFMRIPMSSVLIADDGRSWFESGPVHNLTIADNEFVDCASPQIMIAPENDIPLAPVHQNIEIERNRFIFTGPTTPFGSSVAGIRGRSIDGLLIEDNSIDSPTPVERSLELDNCLNIRVDRF